MKHFVKSVALPATAMKTVGRIYKQLTHLVNIRKYEFVHLLRLQQCEQAERKKSTLLCLLYRDMFQYHPEANGALLLALGNKRILSFAQNLYGRHRGIMDLKLQAPYTVQFFLVNFL